MHRLCRLTRASSARVSASPNSLISSANISTKASGPRGALRTHTAFRPLAASQSLLSPSSMLIDSCLQVARFSSAAEQQVDSSADAAYKKKYVNVAIVAHVDHGKTTLVDALLQSSTSGNGRLNERAMDTNDLEKERGITILSKVTSLDHNGTTVNIVDTPGHADFGGEVERVLSMVDGVCLLVDGTEGPMAQTKFVLTKALANGLKPMVVINKVDRDTARIEDVEAEILDLFCNMNCSDDQLDYQIVYASGKDGWANLEPTKDESRPNMSPLLDAIVAQTPEPNVDTSKPFSMLATMMEHDAVLHLGKLLYTGKIETGRISVGDKVNTIDREGKKVSSNDTVIKIFTRDGLKRKEMQTAEAGNIITIVGPVDATVSNTICSEQVTTPLHAPPIDPPTMSMLFSVNDSPLAGKSGGSKLTSPLIKERLLREAETNVSFKVVKPEHGTTDRDAYEVHGRGEMQLGILIETMRREGFELSVSPPKALMKEDEQGNLLEPAEEVTIDISEASAGLVIEKMNYRKGDLMNSMLTADGRNRMTFIVPSRGLVGLRSELTRETRGDAIVTSLFHDYVPHKGRVMQSRKGVLVASHDGVATAYTLASLEARGSMFIDPGTEVYTGMVIGEASREHDMDVNACKGKQLTNFRAAGKDEAVRLIPPRKMELEDCIGYIEDDELIEITPNSCRIRKAELDPKKRLVLNRKTKMAIAAEKKKKRSKVV